MNNLKDKTVDLLIEHVIYQLQKDFHNQDVEAIEELLRFVPIDNLIAYLPEETGEKYKYLFKTA